MVRALRLATEAQGIQDTGSGEALRLLCAWLQTERAPSSRYSSPRLAGIGPDTRRRAHEELLPPKQKQFASR